MKRARCRGGGAADVTYRLVSPVLAACLQSWKTQPRTPPAMAMLGQLSSRCSRSLQRPENMVARG